MLVSVLIFSKFYETREKIDFSVGLSRLDRR